MLTLHEYDLCTVVIQQSSLRYLTRTILLPFIRQRSVTQESQASLTFLQFVGIQEFHVCIPCISYSNWKLVFEDSDFFLSNCFPTTKEHYPGEMVYGTMYSWLHSRLFPRGCVINDLIIFSLINVISVFCSSVVFCGQTGICLAWKPLFPFCPRSLSKTHLLKADHSSRHIHYLPSACSNDRVMKFVCMCVSGLNEVAELRQSSAVWI